MEGCQGQRRDWVQRASGLFRIILRTLQGWRESWRQRREFNRQMDHLREMDDRLLKDIGLGRSEIDRIAKGRRPWDHPLQPHQDLEGPYRRYER